MFTSLYFDYKLIGYNVYEVVYNPMFNDMTLLSTKMLECKQYIQIRNEDELPLEARVMEA